MVAKQSFNKAFVLFVNLETVGKVFKPRLFLLIHATFTPFLFFLIELEEKNGIFSEYWDSFLRKRRESV